MNRTKIIAALAGVFALVGFSEAAQAAGFSNMAQSGTATGMGTVGTANPDEPNSNFYNPAAMALRDRFNLYIGASLIIPTVEYTSPTGIEAETESRTFLPPNLSLEVPLGGGLAVGLGFTMPWGLAIEWPEDWVGRDEFISQDLRTYNINPNVAYRLPGINLAIAGGAQIMFAEITQVRGLRLAPGLDDMSTEFSGTGNGFGGTAGLIYQPVEPVSLALNYRSAVKLNFDGDVEFRGVEGTPFEPFFVDQPITTNFTVPHTITAGLGWQVLRPLFIGVDVNYMTWSTYDRIELEYEEQSPEPDGGPTVIVANWEDAWAFRIGAEFEVIQNLKLRTGFAYDMTPIPDETVGPSLPDNDRFVIAAGVGYTYRGIRADLGYQRIIVEERVIANGTVDGTYQMGSDVVGLNIGYGFD